MFTHRTRLCRLCLVALSAVAIGLLPAPVLAATPSDWAERLAMATNVSHEGYADSTFAVRAQDSAIAMAVAILADIQSESAADSLAQSEILAALGDYSFRKGAITNAADYWLRAGEVIDPAPPDISLRIYLLIISGHREALSPSLAFVLESRATHLQHNCPGDSILQLWTLAHLCENMWLFSEARSMHERVVATYDSSPDADARWAIRSLVTLGEFTSKRVGIPHVSNPAQLQDSAISLAQRALAIARSQFGTTDTMFAYVADRLGDYYARTGRRGDAFALWDSAWTANRLHLPPEHIEYQGNLDRMASVYRSQGRYLESEGLAKQALELRKKTRGEGHPEVAYMYSNLGRTYHAAGRYRQAEECYREALRIREAAIEQSNPLIAECHRQLGQICFDDGRYALADRHYRTAIELMRDALGDHHSWVAACMRDLSTMYATWGRPEESIEVLHDALEIQMQFLGGAHPAVASTLEEIARTELLLGRTDKALAAINQAEHVDSAVASAGGLPQRSIMTTRARVLLAAGAPAAAESLLIQSVDIRKSQGVNDVSVDELALLAQAFSAQAKLTDAQATFDRIHLQSASQIGLNTVSSADLRDQYAEFLIACGKHDQALEVSVLALRSRLAILREGGQVLSERQALQFERAMHHSRDIMITALLAGDTSRDLDRADVSDLLLASKGAISNSIFARERGLRQSSSPKTTALRDSLHVARHQLATLYIRGLGSGDARQARATLDSVRETKDRLEQQLAQVLGRESTDGEPINTLTDQVRQRLPDRATLVEYIKYQYVGEEDREQYAAITIPRDGGCVLRNLGPAAVIDSLVQSCQLDMTLSSQRGTPPNSDDLAAYRNLAEALYVRIWAPLAPGLQSEAVVLIAPDAELYLLSFAGLIDQQGRYIIESRPIQYLSCGRALAEDERRRSSDGALLLCDPDFDADAGTRTAALQPSALVASVSEPQLDFVTLRSSCEQFSKRQFTRLPGTRNEVESVRMQLSRQDFGAIDVCTGPAASEEYLKTHAGGRRLLHLATHGFYLGGRCNGVRLSGGDATNAAPVGENPLLLSGLCLAGANRDEEFAVEDGILTAEEVASLPLDGTQWVVLSACETRLGETKHGEGVYGLQRAFQMAGASTVISALWAISDRATTSFMKSLYSTSNTPLYDAMRHSQNDMIAELRKRGQPDHPYNWGAFVAVGGWSPLD